jgi:hypothetical protein
VFEGTPETISITGNAYFPDTVVGKKVVQRYTVKNIGHSYAEIAKVTVSLADYSIAATSCPKTLNKGQSCTVDVSFAPKTKGWRNALLSAVWPGGSAIGSLAIHGLAK